MSNQFKPSIRLNEYNGHVLCQTGDLGVNIVFSELSQGIVHTLEQFGSHLYYGYPHKNIFLQYFYLHKRYSLIQELKNFDPADTKQVRTKDIALYLYMARVAQTQKWKYPALLTRLPSGIIDQTTGGSRAFAVGLTKPEPWKHFPVLMLEDVDKDINTTLDNPQRITSDRQLTEILGGVYEKDIWDPSIKLTVEIKKVKSGNSYCLLKHVDDYTFNDNELNRGDDYLEQFKLWKQSNPGKPKLKIYTNYPNRIKDINNVWNWEIVGDTGRFEEMMGDKVGWVENAARKYHSDERTHGDDYVLWLYKDRIVDLGDLLPWMDNLYTTYIPSDWSFALYRPDTVFKTTFIEVSYQQ